jgi:hypothetical protein
MKIDVRNAINLFFPNTSLEFVYYEAVANSLDAGATEINIAIDINSFDDIDSLVIKIHDNGEGFTDSNFEKFNKLLDTDDKLHKGIGRLVFMSYFNTVDIESAYQGGYRRFTFTDKYDGECKKETKNITPFTELTFSKYKRGKVKAYEYLEPVKISSDLLLHFYPRFYQMKKQDKKLTINIRLSTRTENKDKGFFNGNTTWSLSEMLDLKEKELDSRNDFFCKYKLLYSVKKDYSVQTSVVSAYCADNRTLPCNVISNRELPQNYKMIFLLESESFNGKTVPNRENLDLSEDEQKEVNKAFTDLVGAVLKEEMPEIEERNKKSKERIHRYYPHLQGYIDDETIGLVDGQAIIHDAQEKFFKKQQKILEAESLDDDQYKESLDQASRVLTEYVLYRNIIINKLESMTPKDNEGEIHDLIAPKKNMFESKNLMSDIFSNNVWILDDKFMSYSKVMSDIEMETVYSELEVVSSHVYNKDGKDDGRPDITIVFSGDPAEENTVDVVIVELKKLNLKLAKKEEVLSQLKQRARRLLEFYPTKIQRIWFYGIIDFDDELRSSIREDDFIKIYSSGEVYYKRQKIITNIRNNEEKNTDIFLLSYKTMLDDAKERNATFLQVLKNAIQASIAKKQ